MKIKTKKKNKKRRFERSTRLLGGYWEATGRLLGGYCEASFFFSNS
jgi:hypothetical protein